MCIHMCIHIYIERERDTYYSEEVIPLTAPPVRSTRRLRVRNLSISASKLMSGKLPVDLGIPSPEIKDLLESNPLKSGLLVRALTVRQRLAPPETRAHLERLVK